MAPMGGVRRDQNALFCPPAALANDRILMLLREAEIRAVGAFAPFGLPSVVSKAYSAERFEELYGAHFRALFEHALSDVATAHDIAQGCMAFSLLRAACGDGAPDTTATRSAHGSGFSAARRRHMHP